MCFSVNIVMSDHKSFLLNLLYATVKLDTVKQKKKSVRLIDGWGFFQTVDLLKSQRTDKVDITLRPEELEGLDDVALAAK